MMHNMHDLQYLNTDITPGCYSRLAPSMVEALMCIAWSRADMIGK